MPTNDGLGPRLIRITACNAGERLLHAVTGVDARIARLCLAAEPAVQRVRACSPSLNSCHELHRRASHVNKENVYCCSQALTSSRAAMLPLKAIAKPFGFHA
jgi:hypothetical protein